MLPAAPVLGAHVRKSLELAAARPAFALGLRAATATIAPLVFGEVSGRLIFVWMALGGWLCAIVDPGGPHLVRARTMAAFAAAGSLVTALGTLASGSPPLAIAVLFAVSFASSLARVWGAGSGVVGNCTLIQLCIALGSPAPASQAIPRVTMVLTGCALSMFLALVLWPVHAYRPARKAIADCYRELAVLARGIAQLPRDAERAWSALLVQRPSLVRAELERARVALGAVRRGRLGPTARGQQLTVLFETADLLLASLIMAGEAIVSHRDADVSWLEAAAGSMERIATAIEEESTPPAMPPTGTGSSDAGELGRARMEVLRTLELAVRITGALQEGSPPENDVAPSEADVPRPTIRAALAPDSAALRHALRLALSVCVGAAAAASLGVAKAAWITVTVVVVLQPDSGATVRRAVQRALGSIVGAAAAALLVPALRSPTLVGLVLFPLSAAGLALRPVNYGLFTLLVTPVFLLISGLTTDDPHLVRERIINTLIGGGIAFAAQLLWPSRERDQLPERLATLFHRLREYLDQVLSSPQLEPGARRAFGLALANADASFQLHLGEVLEPPERISTYVTLLTYARRFRNAIVMALHSPEADALRSTRDSLDEALEDLGTAVHEQRPPRALIGIPHDAGPAMTRIARQLEVLHSAVERLASQQQ